MSLEGPEARAFDEKAERENLSRDAILKVCDKIFPHDLFTQIWEYICLYCRVVRACVFWLAPTFRESSTNSAWSFYASGAKKVCLEKTYRCTGVGHRRPR